MLSLCFQPPFGAREKGSHARKLSSYCTWVVSTMSFFFHFVRFRTVERLGAGSTQNALYCNSVNLLKESNESNSPTYRMWTFHLQWNFFCKLWRHKQKALYVWTYSTVRKRIKGKEKHIMETTTWIVKRQVLRRVNVII